MSIHTDEDTVRETSLTREQVIMPFYIICDVSYSMAPDISALNQAVKDLVDAIAADPIVDDMTMLSIISFSNGGTVEAALAAPSELQVPTLTAGGGTDYSAAWEAYHKAFEADKQRLKAQGNKVFRPCVFFLTDGQPNSREAGRATFKRLLAWEAETQTGNKAYPYVCSFGFRDATTESISEIAYPDYGKKRGKWFLSRSNQIGALLASMADVIGRTVISSGKSVPTGQPQIIVEAPDPGAGIEVGDAGLVDSFVE